MRSIVIAIATAIAIACAASVGAGLSGCATHEVGAACDDDVDNDGDGVVDCADSDCFLDVVCMPCGDGVVDDNEACDDGNNEDGDGCSALCLIDECGNGDVDAGEECDDGNIVAGDGCDFRCQVSFCGNGLFENGEECDDGNAQSGDGCSSECALEVSSRCGNFSFDPGEECDDGNTRDGDGCSSICRFEFCGDGVLQPGREQCECEDGFFLCDDVDGFGIPEGARCQSCVVFRCGNGTVEPEFGEQCDDGNDNFGDGCTNCIEDHCGDFFISNGEQCDDGNLIPGDGCGSDCRVEVCGDGVVQRRIGELCDDPGDDTCVNCEPTRVCDGDDGDAVCYAVHADRPPLLPVVATMTRTAGGERFIWLGTPFTQIFRYDVADNGELLGNFLGNNFEAFTTLRAGDIDGDGFVDAVGGTSSFTAGVIQSNGNYFATLFPGDRVLDVAVGNAGGRAAADLVAIGRNAVLAVLVEQSFGVQVGLDHIATRVVTVPLVDQAEGGGAPVSAGVVAAGGVHLMSAHVEPPPQNTLVADATVDLDTVTLVADLARADFDGDGVDDLIVLTQGPDQILAFRLDGESGLPPASAAVLLAATPGAESIAAADVDGDGAVDLVTSAESGVELRRAVNGYAAPSKPLPVPESPTRAELLDIDGDGDVDIFYAGGFSGGVFSSSALLLLRE